MQRKLLFGVSRIKAANTCETLECALRGSAERLGPTSACLVDIPTPPCNIEPRPSTSFGTASACLPAKVRALWCIIQSIRCIRDCGQPEETLSTLARFAQSDVWPDNVGLTGTLLLHLQSLSWCFDANGHVWDQFGRFCLFANNLADITWRAEQAWQRLVGAAVGHRPGLRDIGRVNARATKYWMEDVAELCFFVDVLTAVTIGFGSVMLLPAIAVACHLTFGPSFLTCPKP